MIHQHNQAEHDAIMDIAQQIKISVDSLYVDHYNGDDKLNNRIKVLNDQAVKLIDRLESHVKNTQPMDDIVKDYNKLLNLKRRAFNVAGTIIVGVLSSVIITKLAGIF